MTKEIVVEIRLRINNINFGLQDKIKHPIFKRPAVLDDPIKNSAELLLHYILQNPEVKKQIERFWRIK